MAACVPVIGISGSGKTTLTRLLAKVEPPGEYSPTTEARKYSIDGLCTLIDTPGNPKYFKAVAAALTAADAVILCLPEAEEDRTLELLVTLVTFHLSTRVIFACDSPTPWLTRYLSLAAFPPGNNQTFSGLEILTQVKRLLSTPAIIPPGPMIAAVTEDGRARLMYGNCNSQDLFIGGVRVGGVTREERLLTVQAKKGQIISDDPDLAQVRFEAEIVMLGRTPNPIKTGFQGVVSWLNTQVPLKIESIACRLDRLTGNVEEESPESLKFGDAARVVLVSSRGPVPVFGRFLIRNDNVIVAVGQKKLEIVHGCNSK